LTDDLAQRQTGAVRVSAKTANQLLGKLDGKSDFGIGDWNRLLQAPRLLEIAIDLTRRETAILYHLRDGIRQMVETLQQFACVIQFFRWRMNLLTASLRTLKENSRPVSSAKIQSRHRIDHFEEPTSLGLDRDIGGLLAHTHLLVISDSFSSQFGVQENPRAREFVLGPT
jgi:hypothetical protein